ncbi:bifunctional diguanylate cyclase/phosphodiesterase [Reinekea sp.]|jgi:diguanylate cyclase (GGDEF)-like protein|uniref:putative bifunctional diguanylate cyclase/phosphodiesterase n=1 Tax=Reinekea sp. TaxID=1970455 RepID=UPI002A7FF54D|nr:bifunctional diguanylate cyclase/phosphodiesterase [Reinekea sp.]
MHQKLNIGVFHNAADKTRRLESLLENQGHQVEQIDGFFSSGAFDVVFFTPDEANLDPFLLNQTDAVWIAVEPAFLETRFSMLLELGIHDVVMLDTLSPSGLNQVLLRAFHRREVIRAMSSHDSQTGCLNAEGFATKVERAIAAMAASGRPFGICSVDLAEFQKLNEAHGYGVANQVLCIVAQRLALIMGGRFSVGRLGGDEFLLLVENLTDKAELNEALDMVRSSFTNPFELFGKRIDVSAVIGAVLYPETLGSAEDLIAQAHEAMVTGKRYKQQIFLYDRTATPWFQMDMAAEIRRALREDEFQLHYQPRIDLKTNRVVGMEALIRWFHPRHGSIPPTDFIYGAENSGMILPLGNWILARAEEDICWLEAQGLRGLNVAVNLSFKQLQDVTFCENLPKRISNWKASHSQLEFELTETAVLNNPELVKKTLNEIHRLGVKISLDDFGTGYSALVHVQEFPISTVKIDKSFVQRMHMDPSARTIVESIIAFAHRLKLEVVGEGIEQQSHLEALRAMGCEQGQGYYFAKALALADFFDFATQSNYQCDRSAAKKST